MKTILISNNALKFDHNLINKINNISKGNIEELDNNAITVEDLDINEFKKLNLDIDHLEYKKNIKLIISDMDSTMIEQECIDEIADIIGIKDNIAEITDLAMNGDIDFKESLEKRVALLKGIEKSKLEAIFQQRITFSTGAKELILKANERNIYTMLVSGGFTYFANLVKEKLGFNESQANELVFENNILTGKVKYPILDENSKLNFLKEKCTKLNISLENTMAIGDGGNDLPMLRNAGIGIAYKAKDNVKKEIPNQINWTDLSSLKYLID